MLMRIASIGSSLLGIVAIGIAASGFVVGPEMSENLSMALNAKTATFSASDWLSHWRLWSGLNGAAGFILLCAGVALFRKHAIGFIAITLVALVLAVFPWALSVSGLARYQFESASLAETAVFVLIAAMASATYLRIHHDAQQRAPRDAATPRA